MKTKDAIAYYGGIKKLAQVLDIWPHTIKRWGDDIPKAKAYELEVKTKGELKAEDRQ